MREGERKKRKNQETKNLYNCAASCPMGVATPPR